MGIGKRIKEAREMRNLTQKELAKSIGVTPSAVTNYENEISHPKESVIYKMFDALGVDANYLFQDVMEKRQAEIKQSAHEQSLLEKYRCIDERGRTSIDAHIDYEYEQTQKRQTAQTNSLLDGAIGVTTWEEADEIEREVLAEYGIDVSKENTYNKRKTGSGR